MVVRETLGNFPLAAVLALVPVPGVNIFAGEFDFPLAKTDEAYQAYYRGNPYRPGNGMDLVLGLFDHLDLLEEYELDRSLPVDDVKRLERSI